MTNFVDLDRHFFVIPENFDQKDNFSRELIQSSSTPLLWKDILQNKVTVILAEAGAGKTEELKRQTELLTQEGNDAFFIDIALLAEDGVADSLGARDARRLNQWKAGTDKAWFFLDSVDEARLVKPKNFERALTKFSNALDDHLPRIHVFISSRVSDWQAYYDRAMVAETLLPLNVPKQNLNTPDNNNEGGNDTDKPVTVVGLDDLTADQKRLLLENQDGVDVDLLMDAINKADAHQFTSRPLDLIDILNYWKQHGRIGHHAKMLRNNIENKLKEIKTERDNWQPLTKEEAMHGAMAIAAGLTLTRKKTVVLPDSQMPPERKVQSLEAKDMLEQWDAQKISALLTRPIFDEATYGRIQFHHRSVREYLTAQWFIRLLQEGKQRRAIKRTLFASKYGHDLVVPALRPVAAWIALEDEKIQEQIIKIAPEVLIAYGDPSQLPVETRETLLRFMVNLHDKQRSRLSFDAIALRRFTTHDLHTTISKLLSTPPDNQDIRHLLIELIEHGKISQCVNLALKYAFDTNMDSTTRLVAIRAVASAGSSKHKQKLAKAILTDLKAWGRRLTGVALFELFPQYILPNDLVQILHAHSDQNGRTSDWTEYFLREITNQPLQADEFEVILTSIVDILEKAISKDGKDAIQLHDMGWLLQPAIKISAHILPQNNHSEPILRSLEIAAYNNFGTRGDVDLFNSLMSQNQELRLKLFWRRVAQKRQEYAAKEKRLQEHWGIGFYHYFGGIKNEDFSLFIKQIKEKKSIDDRLVALTAAREIWKSRGGTQADTAAIKKAAQTAPELWECYISLMGIVGPRPLPEWQVKQDKRNQEHERQEEERQRNRRARIRALRSTPESLGKVTEENYPLIIKDYKWLHREISSVSSDHGQLGNIDWRALTPEFGENIAHALRDGLQACWKFYHPITRSNGSNVSIPWKLIFGLAGISIEAASTPNWAQGLTTKDATLAAAYSMCELNGLPWWADQLAASHPTAFAKAMHDELKWEFGASDSDHIHSHTLSALSRSPQSILDLGRPMVFDLLERQEPDNGNMLERALTILLGWKDLDVKRLQDIAEDRFETAKDRGRKITWLTVLLGLNSSKAVPLFKVWLSQAKSPNDADDIVIAFAATLFDNYTGIRFNSIWRDYETPEAIVELTIILHKHIRKEEDQHHNGIYTPNQRDGAQSTRGKLPSLLAERSTHENHNALNKLADIIDNEESKEWYNYLCFACAEKAVDLEPWDNNSIVKFAERGVGEPRSDQALFNLALSRLDDLKLDLEHGDSSFAPGLLQVHDETDYRLYFTERLRERALGLYSVVPEEEMADKKKPDIRIHASKVDAPVPIELKIADNWSYKQLLTSLRTQLVGQYMRDSRTRFGIFLLVRKQKQFWINKQQRERIPSFHALIKQLQKDADRTQLADIEIEEIKVVGIDLCKRVSSVG